MQAVENKEYHDMMTQENQWNQYFQGKNVGRIWPNYPQDKMNQL